MPNFEGAQKLTWREPAETFDKAALQKADELLADNEMSMAGEFKIPERVRDANPFAPNSQAVEKATEIISENEVLANADFGQVEKAQASNDLRFDHFGENALTSNIRPVVVPPRKAYVPPPAPKSFLKRLFGG